MNRVVVIGVLALLFLSCENSSDSIDLSDYPEPSAFLRQEIEDRMEALAYQTDEQLLDNMNRLAYIGEEAVPFLVKGLNDQHVRVRGSSAYVLGLVGDRRTIPALKMALKDSNNEVRYEAATALGGMGDREGYSVLLDGLSDEDIKARYKANEALELITGLDFGYHHDDAPETRRVAILKWEAWVDRMVNDER
jgi:HEAT repeat protein